VTPHPIESTIPHQPPHTYHGVLPAQPAAVVPATTSVAVAPSRSSRSLGVTTPSPAFGAPPASTFTFHPAVDPNMMYHPMHMQAATSYIQYHCHPDMNMHLSHPTDHVQPFAIDYPSVPPAASPPSTVPPASGNIPLLGSPGSEEYAENLDLITEAPDLIFQLDYIDIDALTDPSKFDPYPDISTTSLYPAVKIKSR
jgi:hypothetical protein